MHKLNENIYYSSSSHVNISINEEYRPFLTFLFAQAGINLNDVNTHSQFHNAYEVSRPYFDIAAKWQCDKLNNKYYSKAFEGLLNKEFDSFDAEIEKGNRLELLRKNITS